MSKKVYLEPGWVMHAAPLGLVANPPDGYEFVVKETIQEKVFKAVTYWDLPRFLLRSSDIVLPTGLVKSWLERKNQPPEGTALTYAIEHLVARPEPWVLETELAFLLAGRDPKHFMRFKGIVERALASPCCRKIICQSEASRKTLLADLDSSGFEHKLSVVYCTIRPRSFTKEHTEVVKLLFVASDLLRQAGWSFEAFLHKGGADTLETYAQLRKRYDNVELAVRARVPPELKKRYDGTPGLRFIEDFIPWEQLEHEYLSSDIFIQPSNLTVPMGLLEAMSYELAVVTTDSWANAEYVEDGQTGLVGPRSQKRGPYYYHDTAQPNFGSPEYSNAMRQADPQVVAGLAERVSMLIENPELRRRMGKAGRWEVEHGKFSLARVNAQLGRIFDEAIASDG